MAAPFRRRPEKTEAPPRPMSRRFYPLFWFLSLTWGGIPSFFGFLCYVVLRLAGQEAGRLGPVFYVRTGKHWGGMELGMFFLRDCTSTERITYHEAGHSLQNLVLGPFMLPLISIPSFLRYHYRNFLTRHRPEKAKSLPPYDAIWFEGQATRLGKRYFAPPSPPSIEKDCKNP